MAVSDSPWWWTPVLPPGSSTAYPIHMRRDPVSRAEMASKRCSPGVCPALVSRSSGPMTRTSSAPGADWSGVVLTVDLLVSGYLGDSAQPRDRQAARPAFEQVVQPGGELLQVG